MNSSEKIKTLKKYLEKISKIEFEDFMFYKIKGTVSSTSPWRPPFVFNSIKYISHYKKYKNFRDRFFYWDILIYLGKSKQ